MLLSVFASTRRLLTVLAAAVFLAFASTPSQAQDDDPPAQAGRLSFVSGTVSIQPVGTDDWGQAAINLPVGPGDRIFTDSDGRAEIQIGRTYIRIGPNSDVSFGDNTPFNLSIGVAQGSVHIHSIGLWEGQWLHVNTPSGSTGLSRYGELRVDVLRDQQAAVFTSFFGEEIVSGAGGFSQQIGDKSSLELVGSNPVTPQWLQPAEWDALDKWSYERDLQITNAATYRYVSPEIPGANELDASGTWLPGTEYGAIWFPNNVPADWAPYHYGRWVNHAPWGWVWVEDEPWGYAPFHYGRWVRFAGRWGWLPGPPAAHPVWSPALVVFAGGIHVSGVGVSAWFPLGPGEPYRPWYPCSPRYVDQVNITNISESRSVHVQNTYVNIKVTNVTYVNRTIGVSAMNHADFAAGRSAHGAAVTVDAHSFDHVQVLERPEPQPNPHPFAGHPPLRPVPVSAARPTLINEKGMLTSSKPGAQPVAPPVKAAPPVKPLPGRAVAAPPPVAKPADKPMNGGAKPAAPAVASPAAKPVAPPASVAKPVPPPAAKPVAEPPMKPAAPVAPAAKPVDKPMDRGAKLPEPAAAPPTAKPVAPPAPVAKPVPPPAAKPVAEPPAKPAAPPAAKPKNDDKKDEKKK